MRATIGMTVCDVVDPAASADWWAAALDGESVHHGEWSLVAFPLDRGGRPLAFQRVDKPTPGKNRVHLDLEVEDEGMAVAELVGRGATLVQKVVVESGATWSVLADPDGLLFCVAGH